MTDVDQKLKSYTQSGNLPEQIFKIMVELMVIVAMILAIIWLAFVVTISYDAWIWAWRLMK